ncbi:hypothetical protein ABH15_10125 [Methanoculleus taiwanensis]|uniref:Uncharacterized protein n=1 Tax=Methanoculleus taiwanensis TaxID=1550565 RepID=A0A498H0H8_9EURY|nr:hypothetical protein [Methanoculleus taiwanensis]RXE56429.1 hypothetical protein ABH15_10125 [Methanoculleus taiwanensis]
MGGRVKAFVVYLGLIITYGVASLFVWTFLKAYSSPEKAVIFSIDQFGEASLEYLMFLVLMPLMTLALFYAIETMGGERSVRDKRP